MAAVTHGERGMRLAGVLLLAAAVSLAPRHAAAQEVEVRPWSEMLIVVGRDIGLALPDGYIEGTALAVTPDSLDVDVKKTSNAGVYPKGHVTLSRSLVSVIRVRRHEAEGPPVAAPLIGQTAALGGLYGAFSRQGAGSTLKAAGIRIGATAIGVALGKRIDRREIDTIIHIAPDE